MSQEAQAESAARAARALEAKRVALRGGPKLEVPLATAVLVGTNVLVFLAQVAVSRGFGALLAMPRVVMVAFGANLAPETLLGGHLETLLTSCFLHFSILHLGFNMMALWQVGGLVERSIGPTRFLPIYLLSGLAGSLASALAWRFPHAAVEARLSAGASGAICGLMGAAMVLGIRAQGFRGPVTQTMARWLGITFVLGFVGQFDNAAHGGGALAGALLAASLQRGGTPGPIRRVATVALAVAFCLACALRVGLRDLGDPYALLDANARYGLALEAYSARRCDDAQSAISAAARLAPAAPEVVQLAARVRQRCSP